MHSHQSHHHGHNADFDWAAMVADITLEGEVLMPYLVEVTSWIAELCRREGWEVRRILDIGSGPGVGSCVLARQFDSAVVTAVDASPEMLEGAAARAAALGLSQRLRTQQVELPAGLTALDGADLIWAAMVLHHVDDPAATLRGLRALLQPGGVLTIVEFGDAPRFLPADLGVGRPGLHERLGDFNPASLFPSVDYPAALKEAGFELVGDRIVRVNLDAPLSEAARRVALRYLRRIREIGGDRLDAEDREAVDALLDEAAPLGLMRRDDAFLHVARHIYVARAAQKG
jgi:SAM-dependent methyltransferase